MRNQRRSSRSVKSGTRAFARQEHPDGGPTSSSVSQGLNVPTVSLHDGPGNREAHSLPAFFAREQRIEYACGSRSWNPRAVVSKNNLAPLLETTSCYAY